MNKLSKILLATTMAMGVSFAALANTTTLTYNGEVVGTVTIQVVDAGFNGTSNTSVISNDGETTALNDLGKFDALGLDYGSNGNIGTATQDATYLVDKNFNIYSQTPNNVIIDPNNHQGALYVWGNNTSAFGLRTNITGGANDHASVDVDYTFNTDASDGVPPTILLAPSDKTYNNADAMSSNAIMFSAGGNAEIRGASSTLTSAGMTNGMADGDVQQLDFGIYVDKATKAQHFDGTLVFTATKL